MDSENIKWALQQTRTLYRPYQCIETFGDTRFKVELLTEPMDEVGTCRVRSGWVEAARPRLWRPAELREIALEGFGKDAGAFFDWLEEQNASLQALSQYGFTFNRSEMHEEVLHEDIDSVAAKLVEEATRSGDTLRAVIRGADEAWEYALLRFMVEMIEQSHEIHIFDWHRHGML